MSGPIPVLEPQPVERQPRAYARARGKLGQLVRDGAPPEVIEEARRNLNAAVAENRIKEMVDALPTLTQTQRAKLAALLLGGRRTDEAAVSR